MCPVHPKLFMILLLFFSIIIDAATDSNAASNLNAMLLKSGVSSAETLQCSAAAWNYTVPINSPLLTFRPEHYNQTAHCCDTNHCPEEGILTYSKLNKYKGNTLASVTVAKFSTYPAVPFAEDPAYKKAMLAGKHAATPRSAVYIGVPKKSGTQAWKDLMCKLYPWMYNAETIHRHEPSMERFFLRDGAPRDAAVFLIVRNPYSRFLSGILSKGPPIEMHAKLLPILHKHGIRTSLPPVEKIKWKDGVNNARAKETWIKLLDEDGKTIAHPNRDNAQFKWQLLLTPAIFQSIVHMAYERFREQGGKWPAIENPHHWPQAGSLAKLDLQKRCSNGDGGFNGNDNGRNQYNGQAVPSVIPLKVERMDVWFLCLMRAMQVPLPQIVHGFERSPPSQDCFWHPPADADAASSSSNSSSNSSSSSSSGLAAPDCSWIEQHWDAPGSQASGAIAKYHVATAADAAATGLAYKTKDGAIGKAWHSTGARDRVEQYYDSNTARKVHEMFADDFRLFNYTEWDGASKFVDD